MVCPRLLPKTAIKLPFLATKSHVSGYKVAVFGNNKCGETLRREVSYLCMGIVHRALYTAA